MKYVDLTLRTPPENLACDEAWLDYCEANSGLELLRFWEPHDWFVVVGYANRLATEVNQAACQTQGIPVLRRCSGGGTVLQGPGCLNYSLILNIRETGPLHSITETNQYILGRHRKALAALTGEKIELRGSTDLAIGGRKFSGNAQRRKRNCLLFHGTFLLQFEIPRVTEFLRFPSKQPEYRENRSHADFLMNLNVSSTAVKDALKNAWTATEPFENIPADQIANLTEQRYATAEWNLKF